MKTLVLLAAVLPLIACTTDTSKIDQRLDKIEKLIAAQCGGGGRAGANPGQNRPARPEPDRAKTYAVPIDNDAFDGPADAKVTIVEASDYA
jgi:hypothetical protein